MNAILLASGYGRRLRPYTKFTPKCLIKVRGVPLLKIWLNKLERANIKKVLINTQTFLVFKKQQMDQKTLILAFHL